MSGGDSFDWQRLPGAEAYFARQIDRVAAEVPKAQELAHDLLIRTGSRLVDWVDHIVLADGDLLQGELDDLGFELEEVPSNPEDTVFHHPGGVLPRVLLRKGSDRAPGDTMEMAIQVE